MRSSVDWKPLRAIGDLETVGIFIGMPTVVFSWPVAWESGPAPLWNLAFDPPGERHPADDPLSQEQEDQQHRQRGEERAGE